MKTYEVVKTNKLRDMPSAIKEKGLKWCNIKETYDAIISGKVPDNWYDTATGYCQGEVRNLTPEEIDHLEDFYAKKGYVVGLVLHDHGLYGGRYLDDDGQGVGVKEVKP